LTSEGVKQVIDVATSGPEEGEPKLEIEHGEIPVVKSGDSKHAFANAFTLNINGKDDQGD
jgi:hypothetical protein